MSIRGRSPRERGRSSRGRGSSLSLGRRRSESSMDLSLSLSNVPSSSRVDPKDKNAHISFSDIASDIRSRESSPSLTLTTSNTFSPLQLDSPSFKTITSSRISPHSVKQNKSGEILRQSSPRPLNQSYPYILKPFFDRFCTMELPILSDQYLDEPKRMADAFIDPLFFRFPEDHSKRHIFYEFILVDTDSIALSDVFDKIDKEKLLFRKIKLCKIISLDHWGNPNACKPFSRRFIVPEFNYWDYIKAWTYFLYGQNPGNSLSWFIYFDKHFQLDIPFWFLEWWDKYGPTTDILPSPVLEGFKYWLDHFDRPINWDFIPDLLLFFKHFSLTWILMLEYAISDKLVGNINIPYFGRQTKIKWWSGMNIADLGVQRVAAWFNENPTFCKTIIDQSPFLMAKSQSQAHLAAVSSRLATTSTPEELRIIAKDMEKAMNSISSQMDTGSSSHHDKDSDDEDPTRFFGHDED
ncbi:hypothetical protein Dsin_001718 [Dipteronia sinensis]|uniref:Uncharacterized protein n=1 Tax=Dipteronia sinensis TaxID=43782 RepID=A0AAE0EJ93_9ROSI|nr:hypothetical protein Dsin_001718 [Dipteronia sinensis]